LGAVVDGEDDRGAAADGRVERTGAAALGRVVRAGAAVLGRAVRAGATADGRVGVAALTGLEGRASVARDGRAGAATRVDGLVVGDGALRAAGALALGRARAPDRTASLGREAGALTPRPVLGRSGAFTARSEGRVVDGLAVRVAGAEGRGAERVSAVGARVEGAATAPRAGAAPVREVAVGTRVAGVLPTAVG
jgi:hypothetical protein